MPSARASTTPPWVSARAWLEAQGGVAAVAEAVRAAGASFAETLRTPRTTPAEELAEARELLAYWERRARRLPVWAVRRRREARAMATRWRDRVRAAEERRYGRGLLGAATQYAIERRAPATLAHRGRRAAHVVAYTAVGAVLTLLLVFAAALAAIADFVL